MSHRTKSFTAIMSIVAIFFVLASIPAVYLQIPFEIKYIVEPPVPNHPKYPPIPGLTLSARLGSNNKYDENGRPLWGGDMKLSDGQTEVLTNGISQRTARKDLRSRWPGGQIPYKIDQTLYAAKNIIANGMKLWTDNTCIDFNPSPNVPDKPYLILKHTGTGCNSWVGIYDSQTIEQTVSLDHPGCSTDISVVVHELGHAIGLWHEQDRLDRDRFLNVYKDNMGINLIYFETALDDVMHYDVPYDYNSIMQYTIDAFTSNGRLTLVPKDPLAEPLMGTTKLPTFNDYKLVNRMYNCTTNCNINCLNGGYAASNKAKGCRCECPPGFSGKQCQSRESVVPPCGGKITTEQVIQTPEYPNYHPSNTRCAWLIEAPNGKYPQVTINDFQFLGRAGDKNECVWDKFRIRWNDLQSDDPGKMHCGNELYGQTITAPSRQMLITVRAAYGDFGRGFQATVRFSAQRGSGQ